VSFPRRAMSGKWELGAAEETPESRHVQVGIQEVCQNLQLLEHAFLSRSKNNQVIGTLPFLPDYVTVISQEIARPIASVRSRTVVISWIYGPHNL
jgi:hypothetical protein